MPEYIRALVVVIVLASVVFYFVKIPAISAGINSDDFVRRRNTWYFITFAGFLSQSFWIFLAILTIILVNYGKKEKNKIALFFFLILALPQVKDAVPGFGGMNYLVEIDYIRILIVCILLPLFMEEYKKRKKIKSKKIIADYFLIFYILLNLMLQFRTEAFTNVFRLALYWFVDVLIPYYVFSRCIKNKEDFKEIILSFLIAAMIVSIIGTFETVRHWILYASLGSALSANWTVGYLRRGEILRAMATSGQSIVLGYVLCIAIGFYLYASCLIKNKKHYLLGFILLAMGIVSAFSRGPWVGLALSIVIYVWMGENAISKYIKIILYMMFAFVGLELLGYGDVILSYLPFVGTVEVENITYRQNLFEISYNLILENPFFGSVDYLLYMEDLRQNGMIDLVNSYLIIALNYGIPELLLFVGFFVSVLYAVYAQFRKLKTGSELNILGRAIFAIIFGILVIIATVSPIFHVPIFYWSVAALGLAYSRIETR